MIVVFTTGKNPDFAGDDLTKQFERWVKNKKVNIKSMHTNSNGYGWMLTVHYELYDI